MITSSWKTKGMATFQSIGPLGQNVRLSVRVITFEVLFKRIFAPTFRSRMSNISRDLESLGKSNESSGLRFEIFCLEVV